MRKLFLTLILLAVTGVSHAQIVIDQAGDNWRAKVDSAITLIRTAPSFYYGGLIAVCDSVAFFNASFSSCKGSLNQKGTIFVSANDVRLGIQNIAAVLVHESLHLNIVMKGHSLPPRKEEHLAYLYEWQFLKNLPGADPSLIKYAEARMLQFR
jgi:hypothetical protein